MPDSKNYITRPIYIILTTIIILFFSYLLPPTVNIAGVEIKRVEILSDLLQAPEDSTDMNFEDDFFKSDSSGSSFNNNFTTSDYYEAGFSFSSLIDLFGIQSSLSKVGQDVSIQGNLKQLKNFFKVLKNSKKSKIRIAHFGDSIIEGDLVTSQIREELQKKFGGKGVGFVPIITQDITFRQSMKLSFSDNWKSYSIFTSNPDNLPVSVGGEVFLPEGNAWVQYKTSYFIRRQNSFSQAYLYLIPDKTFTLNYDVNGKGKNLRILKNSNPVRVDLKLSGKVKSLKLKMPANSGKYFGVSLEAGNGVYVDNYALRGNSGIALKNIPVSEFKKFGKYLDYKLIVLEFGVNALSNRPRDYSWYKNEMIQVIKNLKTAFPKAGIILVGVHDKSKKKGSRFISDPAIPKLLRTQMEIVKATNIAFWNLNKAMGGRNSMPKWVRSNPPMAFMDYTHFNDLGAKRVAELFVHALLEAKNKSGR
jgi:lysophospholipase L1-like esterase